jgi:hypothetical protein
MTHKFKVGDHVIYRCKFYNFPGEVCALIDSDQVVVKAFGDASGNYSDMLQIYVHEQLEPYEFEPGKQAPLVIFASDTNVKEKIASWVNKSSNDGTYNKAGNFLLNKFNHLTQSIEGYITLRTMMREAIEILFGFTASLESEDAELLRGPEPHHTGEAFVDALKRVKEHYASFPDLSNSLVVSDDAINAAIYAMQYKEGRGNVDTVRAGLEAAFACALKKPEPLPGSRNTEASSPLTITKVGGDGKGGLDFTLSDDSVRRISLLTYEGHIACADLIRHNNMNEGVMLQELVGKEWKFNDE